MIGAKCIHCKKQDHHHNTKTRACPVGKRVRILGFCEYHPTQKFEAKKPKTSRASEGRKDRETRREVKSNPCLACGTRGSDWNPVDPAHIRTFKVTQSDHPANLISLCRTCHKLQHEGWSYFIASYPHVLDKMVEMGWTIWADPFMPDKFHFSHPEIA